MKGEFFIFDWNDIGIIKGDSSHSVGMTGIRKERDSEMILKQKPSRVVKHGSVWVIGLIAEVWFYSIFGNF